MSAAADRRRGGRLDGRLVVVTGGGRGLGLAMARAAGAEGARVVVAELDHERAGKAVAELTAADIDAHSVATDVGDERSVLALADRTAELGRVWALVNNAALAENVGGKPFWDITVAEWDGLHAVNARGPWLVARLLVPPMLDGGGGRIVNIASDAALHGNARLAHYVASKGAVIAMTRGMARDTGPYGVTVNAVAPGIVVTESTADVPARRHREYADGRALQRPQEPRDVAGVVAFLLSDEAAYITGQTLVVDGGFVMA